MAFELTGRRAAALAAVLVVSAGLSACTTTEGTNAFTSFQTFDSGVMEPTAQGLGLVPQSVKPDPTNNRGPLVLPKDTTPDQLMTIMHGYSQALGVHCTFCHSEGATPGFLVWRLSMKWRVAVDRAVAPLGLTHAQYSLVASLYGMQRSGRRPSQRHLADHTGLEALYVSKLARALESAGLVERTRDPRDPRAVQLALTEQGRDELANQPKAGSGLAMRLERLAHSELRAIERAIEILERA